MGLLVLQSLLSLGTLNVAGPLVTSSVRGRAGIVCHCCGDPQVGGAVVWQEHRVTDPLSWRWGSTGEKMGRRRFKT